MNDDKEKRKRRLKNKQKFKKNKTKKDSRFVRKPNDENWNLEEDELDSLDVKQANKLRRFLDNGR